MMTMTEFVYLGELINSFLSLFQCEQTKTVKN